MVVSLSGFWAGETGLEEPEGPGPGPNPGGHGCCFFTISCKLLLHVSTLSCFLHLLHPLNWIKRLDDEKFQYD